MAGTNMLCLTDEDNGDAVFVGDVYTGLPEKAGRNSFRVPRNHVASGGCGSDCYPSPENSDLAQCRKQLPYFIRKTLPPGNELKLFFRHLPFADFALFP